MDNTGETVTLFIFFAVLIQFCVERLKEIVSDKVINIVRPPVLAAAFGILFALLFDLDFFAFLGFATNMPFFAKIITGLILSSGSAGMHELISVVRDTK